MLTRACELESADGCFELGEALLVGRGVAVDRAQAVTKMKRACKLGVPAACSHDVLDPVTPEEAVKRRAKECEGGDVEACMEAGELQLAIAETTKDQQRALRHLERACKAKHWRGCQAIAYARGLGGKVDEKRALALYQQYCDAGDLDSCCYLGQLAAEGHMVAQDPALALTRFDATCDRGSGTCCRNAGIILASDHGLPVDPARALEYFQRSCDAGEPQGCLELAHSLEKGAGVPVDRERVLAAYLRACQLGHFGACEQALEWKTAGASTP